MIFTSHFAVRKLPNRMKEVRFANVAGHSTMDLGEDLYEIVQTGSMDIAADNDAVRRVLFEDRPGVMAGTQLVDVDTLGMGIYTNCRLVNIEIERVSVRIISYRLTWRQVQKGSNMSWPF